MGYLGSLGSLVQDIIDGLNPGDKVRITYETGTVVEATLAPGDFGARITYTLGPTKMILNAKRIKSIEILQRARPKLAVGDKIKLGHSATVFVVIYVSDTIVRVIRSTSDRVQGFTLEASDWEVLTKL